MLRFFVNIFSFFYNDYFKNIITIVIILFFDFQMSTYEIQQNKNCCGSGSGLFGSPGSGNKPDFFLGEQLETLSFFRLSFVYNKL